MSRSAMPPARAGQERTISVGGTAHFSRIEAAGEVASLMFYLQDLAAVDEAATNVDTPLRARIEAGTGGAGFLVDVDVERGTCVTVPNGVLRATVFYDLDPDLPALAPADTPDVSVGVTLYGAPRPGALRPTRTVRGQSIPNMNTVAFPVPAFASTVTVLSNNPAQYGANIQVEFFRAPAGRPRGSYAVSAPEPQRIPNGTRAIAITNRTGTPLVPTLVFELAL